MKNKVLSWISLIIPYAIILAVSVGFIISILLQKVNFALNSLILGIPAIAAAILILKIQKRDSDFTGSCVLFPFNQQTLIRIFLIIFTISFCVTLLSAIKSTLFLILIVLLYCIILIQIFSKKPSQRVILTEIVFTLMMLIYTITLTSSYYFGSTDIIPHTYYATNTSLIGHVISPELSEYSYFPLYHIWIASSSIISGFDAYSTIIIFTCPVYAISALFIYLLFRRVIKNQQIALLTCLLYSSASIVVYYGTYVVTRTMASIGFIVLLYLLYNAKINENKNREIIFKILAISIAIYIVLVHNVSTPMILLLLFIILLFELIVDQEKYIKPSFIFFLLTIFIGYWLFSAYSFTSDLITYRLNPDKFETVSLMVNPNPVQITPSFASYIFLIRNLAALIFIFFGIIGIIYIIWRKKPEYTPVFGLFSLLTIVFYIPTPIQTLWQAMVLLRFDRFQLLIVPFMVLTMAWGIWGVSYYLTQSKIPVKIISFIIFSSFLIYSCSSIGIIQYNENITGRVSFNTDEMSGLNFIQENFPSNSHIFSDVYTARYLFQPFNSYILPNATSIRLNRGYFIIPKKQFLSYGLVFTNGNELNPEGGTYPYFPTDENIHDLYQGEYSKNKIYTCNSIEIYQG